MEELDSWNEDLHLPNDVYFPFGDEENYNLAAWFVESNTKSTAIDAFFKKPMPLKGATVFSSAYTLHQLIDQMPDGMGWDSWKSGTLNGESWNDDLPSSIRFYFRDMFKCIRWLLRQPCYSEKAAYGPVRKYVGGSRTYDEMNTGDWWWRVQVVTRSSIDRIDPDE